MTTVEQLEQQVQNLAKEQLAEFRRWFAEFDSDEWDAQIEADAAAGKLDALAAEALASNSVPVRMTDGGALRVGNTRVCLDLVISQYENGMTPEDVVRSYDTLSLADVHEVIAYYLRHRDEVQAYMKRREEQAAALRAKIEAAHPPITRAELMARLAAREQADAASRQ